MQQPAEPNVVEMICRYAKDLYRNDGTINEENERKINEIWKQTSTDSSYGRYNAMYLLAKEGTPKAIAAVDYLRKRWNGNVNWAIVGAAAGGHRNLVKKLLADGAMLNYAMYGAGQNGDRELVDWLKQRGGDVFWAISGAAGSSNRELYDELNNEAAAINKKMNPLRLPLSERGPAGGVFLLGAGMIDNPTLFKQLLESGASQTLLVSAIVAAAQKNDKGSLLTSFKIPLDAELGKKTNWLIMGAYAGHNKALMTEYMKKKDQLLWAAQGAGYGGHLDLIDYLLRKVPEKRKEILNFAAEYAARKGDIRVVIMLQAYAGSSNPPFSLDSDYILNAAEEGQIAVLNLCSHDINKVLERDPQFRSKIIAALTKQGFINGNEENVLRTASFIDDPELRKLFITKAHELNNGLELKYLERKSSLLNKFMKQYDLNYNQALAWNSPELRHWLIRSEQPVHFLPDEIVQHIASYVVALTDAEAADLQQKLSDAHQQHLEKSGGKVAFKFSEPRKVTETKDSEDVKESKPSEQEGGPKP